MSDAKKELKASNTTTAIVIALIVAYFYFTSNPSWVKKATDNITLVYIDRGIYSPVHCDAKNGTQGWFVFCTPVGGNTGGLYLITESNAAPGYVISPVNGKARTHLPASEMRETNTKIDIATALSLF